MRSILSAAALLTSAAVAHGQNTMTISPDGSIIGDWGWVEKCAAKPFPGLNAEDSRSNYYVQIYVQQINLCRIMLAARHAGWVDAGKPAGEDPHQPAPMQRPEDMKTPISCDLSKPGAVKCNVDDEEK